MMMFSQKNSLCIISGILICQSDVSAVKKNPCFIKEQFDMGNVIICFLVKRRLIPLSRTVQCSKAAANSQLA